MKSYLLVGVQLAGIGWLLLTGPWLAMPPAIWLEFAGVGVLAWAVLTMKPNRVTPLPELRRDAKLVTRGPYRWVRHPMYTGVLLATLALVVNKFTLVRAAVWLGLLADLLLKLNYEETLLAQCFLEYAAYRQRTRRLLPFVY